MIHYEYEFVIAVFIITMFYCSFEKLMDNFHPSLPPLRKVCHQLCVLNPGHYWTPSEDEIVLNEMYPAVDHRSILSNKKKSWCVLSWISISHLKHSKKCDIEMLPFNIFCIDKGEESIFIVLRLFAILIKSINNYFVWKIFATPLNDR